MKTVAFVAVAVLAMAGSSAASAAERASLTLARPLGEPTKVVIDGRLWDCQGEKCTSGPQGKNQPVVRECARTAKVLGPIVAYRSGERTLDAAQISACNAAQEVARTARGSDAVAQNR